MAGEGVFTVQPQMWINWNCHTEYATNLFLQEYQKSLKLAINPDFLLQNNHLILHQHMSCEFTIVILLLNASIKAFWYASIIQ